MYQLIFFTIILFFNHTANAALEYRLVDSYLLESDKGELVALYEDEELIDFFELQTQESDPSPFKGVLTFSAHEKRVFSYWKRLYTLVNGTDHPLILFLFQDEGVAGFALVTGKDPFGGCTWGRHHWLSPSKNEVVIIDDSWR